MPSSESSGYQSASAVKVPAMDGLSPALAGLSEIGMKAGNLLAEVELMPGLAVAETATRAKVAAAAAAVMELGSELQQLVPAAVVAGRTVAEAFAVAGGCSASGSVGGSLPLTVEEHSRGMQEVAVAAEGSPH